MDTALAFIHGRFTSACGGAGGARARVASVGAASALLDGRSFEVAIKDTSGHLSAHECLTFANGRLETSQPHEGVQSAPYNGHIEGHRQTCAAVAVLPEVRRATAQGEIVRAVGR